MPVHALLFPVLEPFHVGAGLDEELHLHLLELARAKYEIARSDLVAESLADLRDAERNLLPRRLLDVEKIHVDALRRLRPQIDRKSTRLNSSHRCISYAVFCLKKKKVSLLPLRKL